MSNFNKKTFLKADDQDESVVQKNRFSNLKALKVLLSYMNVYRKAYILGFAMLMFSSIVALVSARVMGIFVEKGLMAGDESMAWSLAIVMIIAEFTAVVVMWFGRRTLAKNSSFTVLDIRKDLFKKLQSLSMTFFDHQPQGRIVTRLTHDVEGLDQFFTATLGRIVSAFFMAIFAIIAMLLTDFKIGATLIISIIPAVIFVRITSKSVRKVNRRISKFSSMVNSKLSELLSGLDVIRAFGLEKWSKAEFDKTVNNHRNAQFDANFLYSWTRPLISFMCSFPLLGLVGFGGYAVINGDFKVGLFVTFLRYCERFFQPIMMMAREFHVIQEAFTSAERVGTFLSETTELEELGPDGEVGIDGATKILGKIEFKDVRMSYVVEEQDEKIEILRGLNFSIESGQLVGLVGATGCGKTTTVSLLSRLYDFQEGEILIDGISIRKYSRQFLRKNIGFVSQDVTIIKGSLKENICLGVDFTEQKILEACKESGFSKVMSDGKLNLNSLIFEGGSNLSVGERQLLAFTRIILKNPSILILDEATANIDPVMEKIIQKAIVKVMKGRTALMIAHRLATLELCDQILVFDKGQIVEKGSEEELVAQKGHFYQLHVRGGVEI